MRKITLVINVMAFGTMAFFLILPHLKRLRKDICFHIGMLKDT